MEVWEIDCFDCQTSKVWLIAMFVDVIDELRSWRWRFGVDGTESRMGRGVLGLGVLQDLPLPSRHLRPSDSCQKLHRWGESIQAKHLGCAQTLSTGKRHWRCSSASKFLPETLEMFKSEWKAQIWTVSFREGTIKGFSDLPPSSFGSVKILFSSTLECLPSLGQLRVPVPHKLSASQPSRSSDIQVPFFL